MKNYKISYFHLGLVAALFFCTSSSIPLNSFHDNLRIVIYEGKSFTSYNSELWSSIANLKEVDKNDELSSVIVEEGTIARFYRSPNYGGCYLEIVGPYRESHLERYDCHCCSRNGQDWDNEISSIKLYKNSENKSPGVYGAGLKSNRPKPKRDGPINGGKWK